MNEIGQWCGLMESILQYCSRILYEIEYDLSENEWFELSTGNICHERWGRYCVTMLLKPLSEKIPYIVFKGDTSLSKCHKVIKQFSEEIDITIEQRFRRDRRKR